MRTQVLPGGVIRANAEATVTAIVRDLQPGNCLSNRQQEFAEICANNTDEGHDIKPAQVEVEITRNGTIYAFDVKTVKPNKSGWLDYKRQLLSWYAVSLESDSDCP